MNLYYSDHKKLIKSCIAGKRSAQKALYDEFANDMFRVCLSYANDYDQANDLLQEGFLKVFQKLHQYKPSGSLGGWIRTVIVRNCIDHYRSDKWSKNKETFEPNSKADVGSAEYNKANEVFQEEDFLRITQNLPDGYRTILNLYFLEEYSHKDIAEKLGISEGTSKSQLYKAKNYLKKILEKELTEDELTKYGGLDQKVV